MFTKLNVFIAAMFFVFGTASVGMAGQGMKSQTAEENVPDEIQRSTPSAESSLEPGSGPGTRGDQLTGMEDRDPNKPDLSQSEGDAAQAAQDLKEQGHGGGISSKSSSQKSH